MKTKKRKWEKAVEMFFFLCAFVSVFSVMAIAIYLFSEGFPALRKMGIIHFLFGKEWHPTGQNPAYGIFPMVYATVASAIGAAVLSIPIGLSTAVLLADIAPPCVSGLLRPCVDLLAGIPSVVFGYFGLRVIVPLISEYLGGPGNSLLAVILLLTFMTLPTVIKISEASLRAVPQEIIEGSYALGATRIETIFRVMVPSARSGIAASVVLGMGRAVGETMAVILVCGNAVQIPKTILDMVRPLTANIALEMSYADPFHEKVLFATGMVLFALIIFINTTIGFMARKSTMR